MIFLVADSWIFSARRLRKYFKQAYDPGCPGMSNMRQQLSYTLNLRRRRLILLNRDRTCSCLTNLHMPRTSYTHESPNSFTARYSRFVAFASVLSIVHSS